MGFTLLQVDAFTDRPFAGNPAAVCVLSAPADAVWMQRVAQEMNLSETAFLSRQEDGYGLRWFTPSVEVDLCGHATLASAHALWELEQVSTLDTIRFHTHSGMLSAARDGARIWLDFPARPAAPIEAPGAVLDALGVRPRWSGLSGDNYLIEVEDEAALRSLAPDFRVLRTIGTRGVIVTCAGGASGYDFLSRYFAPGAGIDEDPVTGSAHCVLAPYWAERLGKNPLVGYQASARGGVVDVRVEGTRVHLGGQAVTVLRGELV